jgi:DNA-binding LacI/PurR family transcriptional regulator
MSFRENFAMEFLDGIAEETSKRDYDILFFTLTADFEHKKSYIELCKERRVEGAIFIGLTDDDPHIQEIKDSDIPISVIDGSVEGKRI